MINDFPPTANHIRLILAINFSKIKSFTCPKNSDYNEKHHKIIIISPSSIIVLLSLYLLQHNANTIMFNKDKLSKPMVALKGSSELVKDGTAQDRILTYYNSLAAQISYFFVSMY